MAHTKIHYECLTLVTPIDGCLNYKTPSQCALCQKDYFLTDHRICEVLENAEKIINCDFHKWDGTILVCMKCAQGYTLNIDNFLSCEATTAENEGCAVSLLGRCTGCDIAGGYEADSYSTDKGASCTKSLSSSVLLQTMLVAISMLLVF